MVKKRVNEKGLSPLIATVLLIGFAIAIAILIWFWYGNFVKNQAEKEKSLTEGKLACSQEVNFQVKKIDKLSPSQASPDYGLSITVENKGTTRIDDFRVKIKGQTTESLTAGQSLDRTSSRQFSVSYDHNKVGDPILATITPMIIRNKSLVTCDQKAIDVKIQ
ncbi:MAG TPA: archaellin/type IV pilin N-terminal domain-containing protein [Candidatus Nanoarchaeia archaeon]|nr:archaellin/type IV pilin N-terminal domain-containing protein [Candidatus Nanoarchaeia archaeon]